MQLFSTGSQRQYRWNGALTSSANQTRATHCVYGSLITSETQQHLWEKDKRRKSGSAEVRSEIWRCILGTGPVGAAVTHLWSEYFSCCSTLRTGCQEMRVMKQHKIRSSICTCNLQVSGFILRRSKSDELNLTQSPLTGLLSSPHSSSWRMRKSAHTSVYKSASNTAFYSWSSRISKLKKI